MDELQGRYPQRIHRDEVVGYEGNRNGSQIFICRNYEYTLDLRFNEIYRCAKRLEKHCSAKLYFDFNGQLSLSEPHCHDPNPLAVRTMQAREEIARLSIERMDMKLRQIWNEVSNTFGDVVGPKLVWDAVRGIVFRTRQGQRPRIPRSLDEFERILPEYWYSQQSYRGRVNGHNEETALIFISDDMLVNLADTTESADI